MRGLMAVLCGAFELAMPRLGPLKWHAAVNSSRSYAEALCHQDLLRKRADPVPPRLPQDPAIRLWPGFCLMGGLMRVVGALHESLMEALCGFFVRWIFYSAQYSSQIAGFPINVTNRTSNQDKCSGFQSM